MNAKGREGKEGGEEGEGDRGREGGTEYSCVKMEGENRDGVELH